MDTQTDTAVVIEAVVTHTHTFASQIDALSLPLAYCYHPLAYAWPVHAAYLQRFVATAGRQVWLLGMNPGPYGMVQTGIPFGEIAAVRDWMGLSGAISTPPHTHPKRPVLGWNCPRSEVSGRRLWGWAQQRFGSAASFFSRFMVWNYCPLAFFDERGRNVTPDALPKAGRQQLIDCCDAYFHTLLAWLKPPQVIGVGAFAAARAQALCAGSEVRTGRILHPSPANPQANRGWAVQAEAQLQASGVAL